MSASMLSTTLYDELPPALQAAIRAMDPYQVIDWYNRMKARMPDELLIWCNFQLSTMTPAGTSTRVERYLDRHRIVHVGASVQRRLPGMR